MRTEQFIVAKLRGGMWHSTGPERFEAILRDGFIRPEPNISDRERSSTAAGPRWYPFVRHIGGFSLFDFPLDFDPEVYRRRCPSSSLEAFIPFPRGQGSAVWLEIDVAKQAAAIIDGARTWVRCEREGQGRRCMPHIEGAHIGDMPISSIRRAYLIEASDTDWRPINLG